MEAKVDVRKLQVLNDRINQTIDALNQVRLSVHGLGHSGIQGQINPLGWQGQGYGAQSPFLTGGTGIGGGFGSGGMGFGNPMGGFQNVPGITGGFGGLQGFQHSPFPNPYVGLPYGMLQQGLTPWNIGQGLGFSPFGGSPFGQTGLGQGFGHTGYGQIGTTPWGGGGFGGGLFHSTPDILEQRLVEVRAADPYRITQTFPFVVT